MLRAVLLLGLTISSASCRDAAADAPPRSAPAPAVAPETETRSAPRLPEPTVLWVGGDVLPSGPFRRAMRAGGDPAAAFATVLAPTMAVIDDGFVLVNMEAPVAREVRVDNQAFMHLKQGARRVRTPLNAPPWFLEGLARAGVDGVMLANNHTLDQTRSGLGETIDAVHEVGLTVTGAGFAPNLAWPVVIGEEGARVSVLTYLERDYPEPALEPGAAGLSVFGPQAIEDVRRARADTEAVVAIVHVVYELRTRIKSEWRRWATELVDAGADAVLLHGQHVPAPIETLVAADGRRAVVAYGLGNFVSDMGVRARPGRSLPEEPEKWDIPETREGLLARVELRDGEIHTSFLPIFVGSTRYLVYNQALAGPPTYSLLPLRGCGPATDLPTDWPEPYRSDLATWHGERRDHLLEIARLGDGECEPGAPRPLRP